MTTEYIELENFIQRVIEDKDDKFKDLTKPLTATAREHIRSHVSKWVEILEKDPNFAIMAMNKKFYSSAYIDDISARIAFEMPSFLYKNHVPKDPSEEELESSESADIMGMLKSLAEQMDSHQAIHLRTNTLIKSFVGIVEEVDKRNRRIETKIHKLTEILVGIHGDKDNNLTIESIMPDREESRAQQ